MQTIAYNASKGALVQHDARAGGRMGTIQHQRQRDLPRLLPVEDDEGDARPDLPTRVLELTPLRRLGGDEDLKGSVVYLASEASRHVTGQVIAVDGGAPYGDLTSMPERVEPRERSLSLPAHPIDSTALAAWSARRMSTKVLAIDRRRAIPGRTVQPDVPGDRGRSPLCRCAASPGQALAVRARGRPRDSG